MARKPSKPETSSVQHFFHRISILGILLAVGVIFYQSSQEPRNRAETARETPNAGVPTVHTAAYPDMETPDSTGENSDSTATDPASEGEGYHASSDEGYGASPENNVMEMPNNPPAPAENYETPTQEYSIPESTAPEPAVSETYSQETSKTPEIPATTAEPSPSVDTAVSTVPAAAVSGDNPPSTPPLIVKPDTPPLKGIVGPPVHNFLEIFDFDVSPDWVTSRWSHAATVGPLHTRGYRVPLCTGTTRSDLVGNLTYYFNRKLEVEKITFEGFTGDLDRLIITLQYFHMAKRIVSDPNVLLYESPSLNNKYKSYMRSYYRTTSMTDDDPNHRFWITMELFPSEED